MRTVIVLILSLIAGPVLAVQPDEVLKDPVVERRARDISAGLRCLVCQNQSIDDSDAPLAKDLRVIVRERLQAGDTDEDVRGFVVARYGDFVLLKPPFTTTTLLLWGGPFGTLLIGGLGLAYAMRRTPAVPVEPLDEAERQALAQALAEGEKTV
jgi:cytochrome c-type biogenesis protein CcmH